MKRPLVFGAGIAVTLLFVVAWLVMGGHVIAGPDDLLFTQRNSTDTSSVTRIPAHPSTTPGPLVFDNVSLLPAWATLGSGLSYSGGVLDATAAPQVNSDWNAASGLAQILNKPTIPGAFNFGFPAARTLAVSTSYQASDPSKAAVIVPSYACTNATTVLASSACTLQVRIHTSAVTCSTGTVYYTVSQTVNLGVLLTQAQTVPAPIQLPAGAFFIICPSAGTFTISAVEQTAG